jgi:hypothetical protein
MYETWIVRDFYNQPRVSMKPNRVYYWEKQKSENGRKTLAVYVNPRYFGDEVERVVRAGSELRKLSNGRSDMQEMLRLPCSTVLIDAIRKNPGRAIFGTLSEAEDILEHGSGWDDEECTEFIYDFCEDAFAAAMPAVWMLEDGVQFHPKAKDNALVEDFFFIRVGYPEIVTFEEAGYELHFVEIKEETLGEA